VTGSILLDLLISLGGVLVLVGLSAALGAWRTEKVTEAGAAERLAFDEPDFAPAEWLIDADGRAAFALSATGEEAAVVFALGDGLASRRFPVGALPASADGDTVTLRLTEPSKNRVSARAGSTEAAAAWARRIAGNDARTES